MNDQTDSEFDWVVCCDGGLRDYEFTRKQLVLDRTMYLDDAEFHSLNCNLFALIEYLPEDTTQVCIIEDDDYYHPNYIKRVKECLEVADVIGFGPAKYYNVMTNEFRILDNTTHASLACTAFNLPALEAFRAAIVEAGDPYVDLKFWRDWTGLKQVFQNDNLHIGLGGLWGEPGIGLKHQPRMGRPGSKELLRSWIGEKALKNYYE